MKIALIINKLTPWSSYRDFSRREWNLYVESARKVQESETFVVEEVFEKFIRNNINKNFDGYDYDSCLFILLRIVFDLPEIAPLDKRKIYKGWTNWPKEDDKGNVNLKWPVGENEMGYFLMDYYIGSEGKPYDSVSEYKYFIKNYTFRNLTKI
jgi:hypothetical protein